MGLLVLGHRRALQHFQNQGEMMGAKLKTRSWWDSWLTKHWFKEIEVTSFLLARKVCYALHPHLLLPFLYVAPQPFYTYIKGLYARLVLLTPADVYILHMGTSSIQTRSKNSEGLEQKNIKQMPQQTAMARRLGLENNTCLTILKWKALSGLNKTKCSGSLSRFNCK